MREHFRSRLLKVSQPAYVVALGLTALIAIVAAVPGAIDRTVAMNGWTVPDWLISYEGGFVRRGLFGQVAYTLGDVVGVRPQYIALGAYLAAFVAFTALMFDLFRRAADPRPLLALAFAPFMFLFEFGSGPAVFRKDTLDLLLVAALALAYARANGKRINLAPEIGLAVLPLLVLTHEMFFLYSPYILLFAALEQPSRERWIRIGALWLVSAAAFLASVMFRGDPAMVAKLCQGLAEHSGAPQVLSVCLVEGPMQSLGQTPADGWQLLHREYGAEMAASLPLAVFLLAFAFAPVAPAIWGMRVHRPMQFWMLVGLTLLAGLATLPLFAVAVDWGRFIRLHAVSVGLIVTAIVVRGQREGWAQLSPRGAEILASGSYMAFVIGYAVCWRLNHLGDLVGSGVAGVIFGRLL